MRMTGKCHCDDEKRSARNHKTCSGAKSLRQSIKSNSSISLHIFNHIGEMRRDAEKRTEYYEPERHGVIFAQCNRTRERCKCDHIWQRREHGFLEVEVVSDTATNTKQMKRTTADTEWSEER